MRYPQSSYVFKGHKITMTWIETDSVERFKPITQVYGVCFNDKGEILVCKEGPEGKWQLPGGKPEIGETIEKTLEREFIEEVDIKIKNIKISGIQKVEFPDNPDKEEGVEFYQLRCICEIGELLSQTPDPASGKIWERKFVPADQITEYIKWGEIGKIMFKDAVKLWSQTKNSSSD